MPRLNATPESRKRGWCFTINNPTDVHSPESFKGTYCSWQLERGEEGTAHLQGWLYFSQPKSFTQVKALCKEAHWEPQHGTNQQAKDYTQKEESRVQGPWEYGTAPAQGKRSDLDQLKADIDEGMKTKELSQVHFSSFVRYEKGIRAYKSLHSAERTVKSRVIILWGTTGTGKSSLVRAQFPGAFWVSRPKPNGGLWMDGYDEHETVVFDDFYAWIPFDLLLRICDSTPLSLEVKGGFANFNAKTVVFTTNKDPRAWYSPQFYFAAFWRRVDLCVRKLDFDSYWLEKDTDIGDQLTEITGPLNLREPAQ